MASVSNLTLCLAQRLWFTGSSWCKFRVIHYWRLTAGGNNGTQRAVLFCSKADDRTNGMKSGSEFDVQMLDVLACPLSKKPLRYDAANQELVCDDLGVAYPIVDGIPNLNPHDGRMLKESKDDQGGT
ncbi:protein preY, mitochondrial [Aplysia californica]|uniref:Protein preY, mitochondrial n=1 Tax=Aplysia californica TaxID=6500 RepID=A0ABM0K3K4_APLCA|nr:protein preY, mitochondrial [Aplysia californica]